MLYSNQKSERKKICFGLIRHKRATTQWARIFLNRKKPGPLCSGPFLSDKALGTFTHFQFRKIVKFDEESEYGENKMRKKSFRAQIGLLLKTLI